MTRSIISIKVLHIFAYLSAILDNFVFTAVIERDQILIYFTEHVPKHQDFVASSVTGQSSTGGDIPLHQDTVFAITK